MPDDLSEVAKMISRLEDEAGLTRKAIAQGSNVGASQITRIMAGEARNPSFRVISSIKQFYREHFAADPQRDSLPQRHAPGCERRAGR